MSFAKSLVLGSALCFAATTTLSAETVLNRGHQKDLSLTLYQNGLGFVRDVRNADLQAGSQDLALEDISTQLIPDSLLIAGSGFSVQERRFAFDLLTPSALLEKSIGKTVQFRRFNSVTGKDELISAKILSTQGQIIVERDGRIEVGQPGQLVLDSLPEGLRARPALMARINTTKAGTIPLGLAYLSGGLEWHASYSALLGEDGRSLTLQSWANLTNTTGMDFNNSAIILAAGEINRKSAPKRVQMMARTADASPMMAMGAAEEMATLAPEALGAVHLYEIAQKINLDNRETKQVALLPSLSMKSQRVLVKRFGPVYGQQSYDMPAVHPDVEIRFTNTADAPLPQGVVRLYRKDKDGRLHFIGEDTLQKTPKGVEAKLNPGESFDLTLKRNQTDFSLKGKNSFEAAYEVVIKNAKRTDETVRIEEVFPGQWDLGETSHKIKKRENSAAIWEIDVPAGAETVLTYRVNVRTR